MQPDQVRRILGRLGVSAKAFFNRFKVTGLLLPTARQLAAQQRLGQRHKLRIKLERQRVQHAHGVQVLALQASQACQTASTPGAGCA